MICIGNKTEGSLKRELEILGRTFNQMLGRRKIGTWIMERKNAILDGTGV